MEKSLLILGSEGYVGGTIYDIAKQRTTIVHGLTSRTFDFWGNRRQWPGLFRTPWHAVIIAASLERRVTSYRPEDAVDEQRSLDDLLTQFHELLQCLHARHILFLSTDAVFDGKKGSYTETCAVNPLTPYAQAKAAMEDLAITTFPHTTSVRMSIVYGIGSAKPDRRRARVLARREPDDTIRGATNAFRSPIEVRDAAASIVDLALTNRIIPSVVHLARPRMSYHDFLRTHLLPDEANRIVPWEDPSFSIHDTSLVTTIR